MTLCPSRIIAIVALSAVGASCHRSSASSSETSETLEEEVRVQRLAPLLLFEESERTARRESRSDAGVQGPDPYRVIWVPDSSPLGVTGVGGQYGGNFVGVLGGEDSLVLLDHQFRERARVKAPPGASTVVQAKQGFVLSAGELDEEVFVYSASDGGLEQVGRARPNVRGVRALAWGANRVFALDSANDRIVSFDFDETFLVQDERRFATCRGGIDLAIRDDSLRVTCLFDHALALYTLDSTGTPRQEARIVHDGPIWSSDVAKVGEEFLVVLGGVEDHPLDRSIGSFGNVDSFVFTYRWRPGEKPKRIAAVNVSEQGVVTPKVVHIAKTEPLTVDVFGYGGERRARLSFEHGTAPRVKASPFPPGTASAAFLPDGWSAFANPLLDAWIFLKDDQTHVSPAAPRPTDAVARLGESLFFTELMAKSPTSEGPKSRFTCETCHFEGGVDGRTHHTGRGNVRATTKPLFGLLENRPYFSRAFDPTLTKMVDNEFRVANAGGGADPWYTLNVAEHPFLDQLGVKGERVDPVELRRALMHFLAHFPHRKNPATVGRKSFLRHEAEGAAVFRDRCERCHSARRFSDDPATHVAFTDWEARVFAGDLVWASSDYEKTGIEPYVAAQGARVPSLRRILRKRPYFTNGSSRTLDDVLARFRDSGADAWHDEKRASNGAKQLSPDERATLLAFLELL